MADGKIEIETGLNTSGLDKDIKGLKGKLTNIGNTSTLKGLSNIGATISGVGVAFKAATGAVKAVTSAINDLSDTYEVQAKAEIQLSSAAKNNPYLTDVSVIQLKNYASELQSISTIGDEQLLPMMAQLASTGRTQAEIQDVMTAAVDLSASGMMSLESAVQALNGTFSGNIGMLGRQIGELKGLTEEELRNGKAVDIIKKKYAGMSEEIASQIGGWQQYKNALGDFKEALGNGWSEIKNKVGNVLTDFFTKITDKINEGKKAAEEFKAKLNLIATNDSDNSTAASLQSEIDLLNQQNESYKRQKRAITTTKKEWLQAEKDKQKELENTYRELERLEEEYINANWNDQEALSAGDSMAQSKYLQEQFLIAHPEYAEIEKSLEAQKKAVKNAADEYKKYNAMVTQNMESLDSLNKRIDDNNRRLKELTPKAEAAKAHEDLSNSEKEQSEALAKEIEARDKLRDAYDETLRQKQEEINQRRINGEEISEEAEAQEMYNTAFAAYIKMMSAPEFKGNSGNYSHEKNARAQIADWGKIAGGGDLKEQIKEFKEELQQAAGIVKNHYDSVLEALDEEYNAVIENKYLEEEDKLRIEREYEEKRKGIVEARNEAEKASIKDKLDAMTAGNDNYWTRYKSTIVNLQKLEEDVENSTVLTHEEKEAEKTRITEAATQARKELIASVAADVKNYTDQAVQIMQDASQLMLDTVKNQATAEQAELEIKYRKGEIGEEEYNKKIAESKKKAAKEQYKIQMWQWSVSLLQAMTNMAVGISQAISKGMPLGLIEASVVAAAGGVQIASIFASKPTPPSFSTGGIVGGSSTHGDNIAANLNSREMVMNMGQQKALWDFINGGSNGNGGGANIVINNSASNLVTAQPQISKDKIELMIDARVNDSLKNGRYNSSLNMAQQGMSGDYYGI